VLKSNFLKEKLYSRKAVLGTWSIVPSPIVADIVASSGIDFIIIDSEHGPINFETAQNMVIACESRHVSPVIRVPGLSEGDILKALDVGAHCIHVPNIRRRSELKQLVNYAKYPPSGQRGFSPFTRAGQYSSSNSRKLLESANENVLIAIHIEGEEAISEIDDILTVAELDIIFIGLYDLSKSVGTGGDVNDPKVLRMLEEIVDKTNRGGKFPGTIVTHPEQLEQFLEMGIKYITYSVDCEVIRKSYEALASRFRTFAH
jgi:4-hydroxy-2-oxoheptanedioate aldolase